MKMKSRKPLREETSERLTDAQRDLVTRNLKFAKFKAWFYLYAFPGHGPQILAAAQYGMCRAALDWRPDGPAKFTTYSKYHIINQILKYLKRELSRPEILTDFRGPESEWLAVEDRQLQHASLIRLDIMPLMVRLTSRQRAILLARNLEGLTLTELAGRFGVTRERVRQLEARARRDFDRKCRKELDDYKWKGEHDSM